MTRDDEPKNAREAQDAREFADLCDSLTAGGSPPPALAADDRSLAETVIAMRAIMGEPSLPDERARAIIDAAYADVARGGREPAEIPASRVAMARAARARKLARAGTWIAAACAAAALVFVLTSRADSGGRQEATARLPLATAETSRRADILFGVIPEARAGDAGQRMDAIYADRLAGYRSLMLRGGYR
ncbi:MAG TPA: hypothetical protein VFG83_03045 [Kofleriaceae bacterium]|nr:hypothetical protein [Kofleriaceae bacterium]